MRRELLKILARPADRSFPLVLEEKIANGDIIVEGSLKCLKCGRTYMIEDEIPIMLPERL